MNAPITRDDRAAAFAALYPQSDVGGSVWEEFVGGSTASKFFTALRVAQAIANAAAPTRNFRIVNTWIMTERARAKGGLMYRVYDNGLGSAIMELYNDHDTLACFVTQQESPEECFAKAAERVLED